jgi:hypothetical protein
MGAYQSLALEKEYPSVPAPFLEPILALSYRYQAFTWCSLLLVGALSYVSLEHY